MKNIGRITVILIITLISAVCFAVSSFALSEDINSLYDSIPDGAADIIEDSGITPENNGLMNLNPVDIFNSIIVGIAENIETPVKMFSAVLAVIILSTVIESLYSASGTSQMKQIISVVSALTASVIISVYLGNVLSSIEGIITASSDFMLAYVPVLAGVISVGGHASSASVFSSVTIVGIQALSRITVSLILPFVTSILGISVASSFGGDFKLERLGDGIKKGVVWALGLVMTLFIGILSLQSIVASSADSVGLRTIRFAVSSAVPFVGNAVSDALSTVKTSVSLLKTGIGGFGVVAAAAIILPALISVLCYKIMLFITGIISDIFGCESVSKIIRSGENVISILFAILSCFFVFITITTAMMLVICRAV